MEENKKKTAQDANQRESISTPNNENSREKKLRIQTKKEK